MPPKEFILPPRPVSRTRDPHPRKKRKQIPGFFSWQFDAGRPRYMTRIFQSAEEVLRKKLLLKFQNNNSEKNNQTKKKHLLHESREMIDAVNHHQPPNLVEQRLRL